MALGFGVDTWSNAKHLTTVLNSSVSGHTYSDNVTISFSNWFFSVIASMVNFFTATFRPLNISP